MYETRTYFPFKYDGELPESVIDLQWRQQIRSNLYSKIQFQEHLAGSTISSLNMKCKKGAVKLELPAQVELNGVKGMMHRAHVNYFSNNIGIASITFHPARIAADTPAAALPPEMSDGNPEPAAAAEQDSEAALEVEEKEYQRSSIKDVLDVQQAMLGNEKIVVDHGHAEEGHMCSVDSKSAGKGGATTKQHSIGASALEKAAGCVANHTTSVQQLLEAIVDYAAGKNPHIKSWERLPIGQRPFIVNRVEVDYSKELAAKVAEALGEGDACAMKVAQAATPPPPMGQAPASSESHKEVETVSSRGWDRCKLNTWTYALSSFAWTEKLDMQDNYLDKFIQQNCYLRFASDFGGLWLGFRNNGGAAVYYHHFDAHGKKVHDTWMENQNHWPPATETMLQLVPALLYQRTFLQMEVQRIRKLINKTAAVKSYLDMHGLLSELKDIEGRLLRFNLLFCDEISQDMAAQEVFEIWQRQEALTTLKENLVDHVQELSAFYRNISAATQQDKLDLLTVVVVNLGLAQILYYGLADGHTLLAISIVTISIVAALYYHGTVLNRSVFDASLQQPVLKYQKALLKRLRLISVRLPLGTLATLVAAVGMLACAGYVYSEEILELALTTEEAVERAVHKSDAVVEAVVERLPEVDID
eukprot:CAMPEP_0114610780 /NCGR_PEP_ID=MMETSP0168-20121206/3777_1 /TAXON_ID=95228 ORGANISM="Vannella sp., Strain DIVA3 517/6/12" /NCGR_SAMPLE_ID=MMETSP0168 /ASSEMBLY_ACC=CAM_ASM_000044 /LENGTH=644 /DNA_ID=CAMNT_0001821733 /DNA_START=107 /DNA_END=2038 /DNA_ORIENTATION=-